MKRWKSLTAALCAAVLLCGFSVPSYALSLIHISLCELVVGGKDGLQPIEKTVIDRCVRLIYRDMALGIGAGKPPLLQDLYEELLKQPEPEARRVATALEPVSYTHLGSGCRPPDQYL